METLCISAPLRGIFITPSREKQLYFILNLSIAHSLYYTITPSLTLSCSQKPMHFLLTFAVCFKILIPKLKYQKSPNGK